MRATKTIKELLLSFINLLIILIKKLRMTNIMEHKEYEIVQIQLLWEKSCPLGDTTI